MIASRTRKRVLRAALSCAIGCALCACASVGEPGGPSPVKDPDPWQKMNRGIFAFNEATDIWVIGPVAKAWSFVFPRPLRQGIQNFSENLWMPAVFGNHLLQARPKDAFAEDLPRFLVNTTLGLGGIFDVATRVGIEDNYTDFGITMGRWGLPPGPYFVIPFLGPSSVRGVVGRVADGASTPYTYFVPWYAVVGLRSVELLNLRSLYAKDLEHARADSFDYYVFIRDAWMQNRAFLVRAARDEPIDDPFEEDDLYFFDDEDEEEEADMGVPASVEEALDEDADERMAD